MYVFMYVPGFYIAQYRCNVYYLHTALNKQFILLVSGPCSV